MTEIDKTNRSINYVVQVSEMVAANRDRGISNAEIFYDMDKLLEEAYANEYNEMKKEDLPFSLDIFEEGFGDSDAGWLNWECKSIRKWIENKAK